jgi:hypothetical protein
MEDPAPRSYKESFSTVVPHIVTIHKMQKYRLPTSYFVSTLLRDESSTKTYQRSELFYPLEAFLPRNSLCI